MPFGRAFGVRLFTALGAALIIVAVAGGVAAQANGAVAAAWAAVAAGVVLVVFSAAGVLAGRVSRRPVAS